MSLQPSHPMVERTYFRRRFHTARRPLKGLMIVTPWINLVLLLLLFMITQSSFVVQPGVQLDLPVSIATGFARYGDLVLSVPQEGMYFFNDERMTAEELPGALAAAAQGNPDSTLIIEADQHITHRSLAQIYNFAEAAGLRRVLLATRSPATP